MMTQTPSHIADFKRAYETAGPAFPGGKQLGGMRDQAMERFLSLGLPVRKAENWRYFDLTPLRDQAYSPALTLPTATLAMIDEAAVPGLEAPRLVFVNGRFSRTLSDMDRLPDTITCESLHQRLLDGDDTINRLGLDLADGDAFDQLNTAMLAEGLVIDVPDGVKVDQPLELVYLTSKADGLASHLRLVIRMGKGAELRLAETIIGDDSRAFTNLITQITLADDARLICTRRQLEGSQTVHVSRNHVTLGDALYELAQISTGGKSARHELLATFTSEGGHVEYKNVQLAGEGQIHDTLTLFDHAVPQCTSMQTYRGVLDKGSKASFQGKVLVRQDAQKTDARQKADSLILDRSAEANAKPELEIYADDVQCAHGATVGELSQDQLFYLNSRGLSPREAKAVLVEAFIAELCESVEPEPVRNAFLADARTWLDRHPVKAAEEVR